MIKLTNVDYLSPTKLFRRLSVLLAVRQAPNGSQHAFGKTTQLSSSMVNNYIKELEQDKLITVAGNTNRTQSYHLTTQGINSLRENLLSFSAEIVRLYGSVKNEIANILNRFYDEGIRTVVLFGVAETAEVVHAALKQTALVVIGVVDSDITKQGRPFNGLTIQAPEAIKKIKPDAVVITSFGKQEEIYSFVYQLVGDDIKIKRLTDV